MWTIIKIDLKKINTFTQDIRKKVGNEVKIYSPKIKTSNKHLCLLGDYIFCFHSEFKNSQFIENLKFTKGLKYFLRGHIESQNEIKYFINKCKSLENEKGFLTKNICELIPNTMYEFKSGLLKMKFLNYLKFKRIR